ncbi:hypothetical protein KY321_04555 [Candidatus Woesearchaeota archaeon]|nr:hypothetical protein [Candidatus Woesearchaeota archaeon]
MIEIRISKFLLKDFKKYLSKPQQEDIINRINSFKDNFNQGKLITQIGLIQLKEIKLNKFRIYFLIDKNIIKVVKKEEVESIIKFISISTKKNQQKIINKIKENLRDFGFDFY